MSKNAVGKKLVSLAWVLGVLLLIYCFPRSCLVFLLLVVCCGVYDFLRNGLYDRDTIKKYFIGNGRNTWVLAPFNTLLDLLSSRNRHVYTMNDLPPAWREDLQQVIDDAMARKDEIISYLDERMAEKKRGMLFFQWYGRPIETTLDIPQLRETAVRENHRRLGVQREPLDLVPLRPPAHDVPCALQHGAGTAP